jgi:coenzyme F420-0:L-glutamate ligase / coenzyme F420-1:gamma-L-glutamate ligase
MDADAFFEVIRSRRSVREFTERVPDQHTIERLIDAAQWAPSNHNRQGWKFIVFRDRVQLAGLAERIDAAVRETLAAANRLDAPNGKELLHYSTLFAAAPVVILAMHKRSAAINRALVEAGGGGKVSGEAVSTAMAVENLLLASHVLGLGACVMTAPLLAPGVWERLDNVPVGFQPTCVVAVGYPAQTPPPPRRKPLDQIADFR